GRGLRRRRGADIAAGARTVLDDDVLPPRLGELLREDAPERVDGAAARKRNDYAHRAVGIALRPCVRAPSRGENGGSDERNGPDLKPHGPSPDCVLRSNRSHAGAQKNERISSAAQNAASNAAKIERQDWENSGAGEGNSNPRPRPWAEFNPLCQLEGPSWSCPPPAGASLFGEFLTSSAWPVDRRAGQARRAALFPVLASWLLGRSKFACLQRQKPAMFAQKPLFVYRHVTGAVRTTSSDGRFALFSAPSTPAFSLASGLSNSSDILVPDIF